MEYHSSPIGSHMGVAKTLARLSENVTWSGIIKDVERFLVACVDCQYTKYETRKGDGLLCPLSVSFYTWEDLSLDFIVGLLAFRDHTAILVVVNHFLKGIHLGMLPTHHTSHTVVVLFMDIVGKLHEMPQSLVFDHDPLFINHFWQALFKMSGTWLQMSSVYHPQTDRQIKVLNRVIEQCLRAFVHKKPSSWGKFLNWVE